MNSTATGTTASIQVTCRDNSSTSPKRAGTIDAAFVVTARVRKDYTYIYVGHRDAEELYEMLKDVPPRKSEFGEYWLLKPDVTPLGVAASDDDYDDDDDFDF